MPKGGFMTRKDYTIVCKALRRARPDNRGDDMTSYIRLVSIMAHELKTSCPSFEYQAFIDKLDLFDCEGAVKI